MTGKARTATARPTIEERPARAAAMPRDILPATLRCLREADTQMAAGADATARGATARARPGRVPAVAVPAPAAVVVAAPAAVAASRHSASPAASTPTGRMACLLPIVTPSRPVP